MKKLLFLFFIITAIYRLSALESLTFTQARELAILNSVDLRHARASQELMEKAWRWGLRAYFPQISITASENDRLQKLGADSFMKNYSINLDQLLFDGGRTRISRNLEKTELEYSSSKLEKAASEIGESAISAYIGILSARKILEVKKNAFSVLEEQRRILSEEVSLGMALNIDLASADINLSDAKIGINSLELDLKEMEKQFAELLGLETLPILTERVDVNRSINLPNTAAAAALAKENNPDLTEARYSITRRRAELKYVSNSWMPTLRLAGSFGVTGPRYPLTRYNWSVGVNIEFTGPWISNRTGFQMGGESPNDRTAMLHNTFTPLPDPASSIGKKNARLALALELEKFEIILERIERITSNIIDKCSYADERRRLALQAVELGEERRRIEEVRLNLGQITRLKLMETLIEQTQREVTAIEAASALLEAERELERFLDLKPGELETFVSENNSIF